MMEDEDEEEDEDEAASWLLLNNNNNNNNINNSNNSSNNNQNPNQNQQSNGFLFGGEVDEYLDLVDCNSCGDDNSNNNNSLFVDGADHYSHQHQQQYGGGGIVGQKNYGGGDSVVPVQQGQHFQLGLEFEPSKAGFNYSASISQSVSVCLGYLFIYFFSKQLIILSYVKLLGTVFIKKSYYFPKLIYY